MAKAKVLITLTFILFSFFGICTADFLWKETFPSLGLDGAAATDTDDCTQDLYNQVAKAYENARDMIYDTMGVLNNGDRATRFTTLYNLLFGVEGGEVLTPSDIVGMDVSMKSWIRLLMVLGFYGRALDAVPYVHCTNDWITELNRRSSLDYRDGGFDCSRGD
jgi:hypothetical protein